MPAEEPPTPEEEFDDPRVRALMEGSGRGHFAAEVAVHGIDAVRPQTDVPASDEAPQAEKPARMRRTDRRGGRAYPESDRDEVPPPFDQPTEEEAAARRTTYKEGGQLAKRGLAAQQFEDDVRKARELGISVQAVTFARLDREARRRKESHGD